MLIGRHKHILLFIVLILSFFVHVWNPSGFPATTYDEGVYIKRALHFQKGLGVVENDYHDHPFFGQVLLGTVFSVINYPDIMGHNTSPDSISLLYSVPRAIMGIFAVIDTLLVYKIIEVRYSKN